MNGMNEKTREEINMLNCSVSLRLPVFMVLNRRPDQRKVQLALWGEALWVTQAWKPASVRRSKTAV